MKDAGMGDESVTGPGQCVLIVEDDEDNRSIYRAILEDAGHRVLVADHGEAAIEALQGRSHGVSLILLDLMMPTLGGLGFLKRKAADPALADLPVVIVSAIPDLTPIPHSDDIRAVLTKPVSMPDLLEVIQRCAVRAPRPDGPALAPQP
jgi:two-component system chemotaxis response regulator CheY